LRLFRTVTTAAALFGGTPPPLSQSNSCNCQLWNAANSWQGKYGAYSMPVYHPRPGRGGFKKNQYSW